MPAQEVDGAPGDVVLGPGDERERVTPAGVVVGLDHLAARARPARTSGPARRPRRELTAAAAPDGRSPAAALRGHDQVGGPAMCDERPCTRAIPATRPCLSRRQFLLAGGTAVTVVALSDLAWAQGKGLALQRAVYPRRLVGRLSQLRLDQPVPFARSMAIMLSPVRCPTSLPARVVPSREAGAALRPDPVNGLEVSLVRDPAHDVKVRVEPPVVERQVVWMSERNVAIWAGRNLIARTRPQPSGRTRHPLAGRFPTQRAARQGRGKSLARPAWGDNLRPRARQSRATAPGSRDTHARGRRRPGGASRAWSRSGRGGSGRGSPR
jgi:hypothetical protein